VAQCTWGKKEIFDDNAELMKYLHYVQFVMFQSELHFLPKDKLLCINVF